TSQFVAPVVSSTSQTVLGIISTQKSVYVHVDAPSNLNLHASIYAGNSATYDIASDSGCGIGSNGGCGFGVQGWNTKLGAGALKLFGGIAEYQSQTTGSIALGGTGYRRQYTYDTRL